MFFAIHCHESAMDLHVFPILNPPLTFLPIPSLWVIPVHQPGALVSCIQPGLVICFTLDNIHVSMLFCQIIPPSPSPLESKSLFYTSVSLSVFFKLLFPVYATSCIKSLFTCLWWYIKGTNWPSQTSSVFGDKLLSTSSGTVSWLVNGDSYCLGLDLALEEIIFRNLELG